MVKDAGDYFGMRGLNQECSNAAYEDGGITHDQPRHRVWAKKTGVAPVASSPIQRVRRMSEEIVGSVDNSLAQRQEEQGDLVPSIRRPRSSGREFWPRSWEIRFRGHLA